MRRKALKSVKYILTVLLVIIIAASAIAADGVSIVDRTVLNPGFYGSTLQAASAYDGVYDELVGQIASVTEKSEGLPEAFKGEMEKTIKKALPKEAFTAAFSKMMGETMNWVLYNGPEVTMPFHDMVDAVINEISKHPTVVQTEGLQEALTKNVQNCFKGYLIPKENGNTLRDYVHYYMGGGGYSEQTNQKLDFMFDGFIPANVGLVTKAMYISWAAFVVAVALLFVLWRKDMKKPLTVMGIVTLIVAIANLAIGSGVLLMQDKIMAKTEAFSSYLPSFISGIELGIITSLAIGVLISGGVLLVIGIGLLVVRGIKARKAMTPMEQKAEEAA